MYKRQGTIFWSIGELDKAKFEFEKVLHINPNIPTIQNNLASIYLKKGEFKKAIPHLETLINLQPKNVNAKKLLQFSLEQLK